MWLCILSVTFTTRMDVIFISMFTSFFSPRCFYLTRVSTVASTCRHSDNLQVVKLVAFKNWTTVVCIV